MRTLPLLAFAVPLLAPAWAQTKYQVSPAGYDTVSGKSANSAPFYYDKCTYMQLHDDLAGPAKVLKAIAFRQGYYTDFDARVLDLTLTISSSSNTAMDASLTFASNHGNDLSTAFSGKVSWPASLKPVVPPASFLFEVPFQKPFPFPGLGSLCWEIRIHSNSVPQKNAAMDFAGYDLNPATWGAACKAAGKTIYATIGGYIWPADTAPYRLWHAYGSANNLANSQPFGWFIGFSNMSWAGVPLPLDLAPLGAAGCSLYAGPTLVFLGITDANGRADTFSNGVDPTFPEIPSLSGTKLYTQFFSLDPGAGPLGTVWTNGAELVVPRIFPHCRLYRTNDDLATTAPWFDPMNGLVVRFAY